MAGSRLSDIAIQPQVPGYVHVCELGEDTDPRVEGISDDAGRRDRVCQAVIGTAFSNFATLDKKWKRRIEMLPSNNLARIYYGH